MKKYKIIQRILFIVIVMQFSACENYLDKTPHIEIEEEDIFVNFESFQAWMEVNYTRIVDYNTHGQNSTTCYSDASVSTSGSHWHIGQLGNYRDLYTKHGGAVGPLQPWANGQSRWVDDRYESGLWWGTWRSQRANNMALEKLNMFNGTDNQRDLLEGQALFFRAFFFSELCKWIGGLPYITRSINPNEEFNEIRLSVMATMDKAAIDFDSAANLLPLSWDHISKVDHPYGTYTIDDATDAVTFSNNTGRATKGAAYAMKALAMLWAGSPTSNLASKGHIRPDGQEVSGEAEFDLYYMEEAAKAAANVIEIAEDDGMYELVGYDEYQSLTARDNNENPWYSPSFRREVIWAKVPQTQAGNNDNNKNWCTPAAGGGVGRNVHATQNQVDRYEMSNGLPIEDPASGYNPDAPWDNRDPRLNASVILPNETVYGSHVLTSYRSGQASARMVGSYLVRKYLIASNNSSGGGIRNITAFARLAEMYLVYAEAVNEIYGPNTRPAYGKYTAVEAVNIVRQRALSYDPASPDYMVPLMPPVNDKFTGTKELFRERVRNERDVELAYEAKRWFDIRRWNVAHLKENKDLYILEMDFTGGVFSNFERRYYTTRVFDKKHYWCPIPEEQAQMTEGFYQTPGW